MSQENSNIAKALPVVLGVLGAIALVAWFLLRSPSPPAPTPGSTCSGGLILQLKEFKTIQIYNTFKLPEGKGLLFICKDDSCKDCTEDGDCPSAVQKENLIKRPLKDMLNPIPFFSRGVTIAPGSYLRLKIWDPTLFGNAQGIADIVVPAGPFPVKIAGGKVEGEIRCNK